MEFTILSLSLLTYVSSQVTVPIVEGNIENWTAMTNKNQYTQAGNLRVCMSNINGLAESDCVSMAPRMVNGYHVFDDQPVTPNINFERFIKFRSSSAEQLGLSAFCPLVVGPASSTMSTRAMITDASPNKYWLYKPWGGVAIVSTILQVEIEVGHVPIRTQSPKLEVTYLVQNCLTAVGFEVVCDLEDITDVIDLTPGSGKYYATGPWIFAFDIFLGYSRTMSGITIKNTSPTTGNNYIPIKSIKVYDQFQTHCLLKNNYGGSFSLLKGASPALMPCAAPALLISASPLSFTPAGVLTQLISIFAAFRSIAMATFLDNCDGVYNKELSLKVVTNSDDNKFILSEEQTQHESELYQMAVESSQVISGFEATTNIPESETGVPLEG